MLSSLSDHLAVGRADEEVDARQALALARDERLDGAPLQQLDRLLREARRRNEELHPAFVVLRGEVVPLVVERVDLAGQRGDRRRHAVAEDADLDLGSVHELLDEHLLVVSEGERDGRPELVLAVHLRDADRGAEPRGLHEHRVAERVLDRVAEPDRVVRGDRDAAVAHDLLEQVLVHRERRGRDAGADVGNVRELEQALHRAVLAERAVQERQNDVHGAERLERPGLGRNGQCLRRTRLGAWHQDVSRIDAPAESPAPVAADRDLGDLVPLRIEGRGDRARRRQGDLVLARAAAGEDGHPDAAG